MKVISRDDADATKFYMGSICKRGHSGKRYRSSGHCVQCVQGVSAAYRAIPEVKAHKAAQTAAYRAIPEVKAARCALRATPEYKLREAVHQARYRAKPKVKAAMAVRQAMYNATRYATAEAKAAQADYKRWRQYGITPGEYNFMLAGQQYRCAIIACGTDDPGSHGKWNVDHCHTTGKVRGLLCNQCNLGLGQFKDSPARLISAAEYLTRAA